MVSRAAAALPLLALVAACQSVTPPLVASAEPEHAPPATPEPVRKSGPMASAEVGKPAPDFDLKDLDGKPVHLATFKGKTVVLEWFNPGCPFVKAAHTKGSLRDTAKRAVDKGVVWLAINSASSGKQGFGVEANKEAAQKFGLTHPILLDDGGDVGHAYGATNTPHLFVIDPQGTLVYAGAIDNSPDGEGESPEGGKLVNYVDAALADLGAGRRIATSRTKAYGCSVKYGSKS
jgi:peroxiredoxin